MKFALDDMGIYELGAPNRWGKTFTMAKGAWDAYLNGKEVWCNCSVNPKTGQIEHTLNFPHRDYDPYKLFNEDLLDVYVITDQGEQVMDARACAKKDIRNLGYFNYQAKKRGIAWRYDTVRHKNIDPRIRLNPDFIIYPYRIPKDWRLPLQMIRLRVEWDGGIAWLKIKRPEEYFPIYNHMAMQRPPAETIT
jgi:hypothetical protein